MKKLLLLCLFSLSVNAQVVIGPGSVLLGSSGGGGSCPTCALTNLPNVFTQTNTFPALNVTSGINGLPLYENTGLFNIGIGVDSTPSTATGTQNLGIGDGTLPGLTTGYDNTSIGVAANGAVTTGGENTAIGTFALQDNVSGNENTGVGSLALANATGSFNTALGESALNDLITGNGNTSIGYESGCGVLCASSGGPITAVSNGVYIGYQAGPSVNSVTNQVLIGYGIQSATSNYMQLGNSSITTATIYGAITIPNLAGGGSGCVAVSNTGLLSSTTCGSGGSGPTFQVNGTGLTSSTTINFENGSNVAITNPSAGNISVAVSSMLFSSIASATNTTAAMLVGTGASLGATGSGTIAATSVPFSGVGAGTNTGALVIGGSLSATGGGTITATALPYTGLTGSVPTWNQSTTGNAATATALAATPTLCSTGSAPTGILPNGNATGCAAIGGGGGGGPTIQTNTVNNSSQTLLNFVSTASVVFTNPSGGVVSATVPTSTSSVLGISSPDNTTIGATAGAYHVISPGASTIVGFNASNAYTGFTLGTGLAFSGSTINSTGITGTLSTTNCIPKQATSTSVTCTGATDNGTTFAVADNLTVAGSGGITVTGTIPGVMELAAGTGSIPALPSNSYGDVGPTTGGTPYLRQHPNTAAAGFELYAAPATLYGVNVIQSSFVHIPFHMDSVTSAVALYPTGYYLSIAFPQTAGHFSKLQGYYDGGGCSTPPSINVLDVTQSTSGTALALNGTGLAQNSQTLTWNAGDEVAIQISTAGSCTGSFHTVSADGLIP